jgi:hypothetical protein
MRERLRRILQARPLVPVAGATSLFVLAALLAPERVHLGGGGDENKIVVPDVPLVAAFLLVVLVLALLILFIVSRAQRPRREAKEVGPRKKRGWFQALGILLLPVMWVVSRPFRDAIERLLQRDPGGPTGPVQGASAHPAAPTITEHSGALGGLLTLLLLVLVLGTCYLIYEMSRKTSGVARAGKAPSALQAALALGIEDLQQIGSPRAAVIASYSRMQALADRLGARRDTDTPLELMDRLVAGLHVPRGSIGALTSLFEKAKFSTHEIDESMRTEALQALTDVRDGLEER